MRSWRRLELNAEQQPAASAAEAPPVAALQRRLGYVFATPQLLRLALTHKSAGADNFERFEFLGDAALGYMIARLLFDALPAASEQQLTLMRANLVNTATLAEVARQLDLGAFVQLGLGERRAGGANRTSILADALEAVLGAIVCDGGIDAASDVARTLFSDRLAAIACTDLKDPKTRLQEALQAERLALPRYEVVDTTGKPHAPFFTVRCIVQDMSVCETGRGNSRREAEKAAATAVLRRLAHRDRSSVRHDR